MNRTDFQVTVAGKTLQGHLYNVEKGVAVVIIVHGMGEYGRRYERTVIPYLLNNSIAVIAYDQFGHGLSAGKKGHHPGYSYLLDSVDRMIEKASENFPELPVFLYGHSMGGNVVLNFGLDRPEKIRGLVVTSPFLKLAFEPPSWKISLAKLLGGILPSLTLANEIDPNAISRDKAEVKAYQEDPLIHDRVSPAYSIEFMKKGQRALQRANELKKPALMLHGTADRLTDPKATEEFAKKAGGLVEFQSFEGAGHELHHELERDRLLKEVVEWIRRNL